MKRFNSHRTGSAPSPTARSCDFAVLALDGPVVSGAVNGDMLEVQLEAGLEDHTDAKEWLVEFEPCVAWAWIDLNKVIPIGKPPAQPGRLAEV